METTKAEGGRFPGYSVASVVKEVSVVASSAMRRH